jgi:hypothetical protein
VRNNRVAESKFLCPSRINISQGDEEMNGIHACLLAGGVAATLLGCGATGEVGSEAGEPQVELASETVLHEFESGGDKVKISSFTGADESRTLMMQVDGSAFRPLVVDRLLAETGVLTFLEIFKALAPSGQSPGSALIQSHAGEALALGRETAAVVAVTFDALRGIEKSITTTACSQFAFPPVADYTWVTGVDNTKSGTSTTYIGNDPYFMTSHFTGSAICKANDSGSAQESNWWSFSTVGWNSTTPTTLGANQMKGWYMPAGSARKYAASGVSGSGSQHHGRVGALIPQ